MVPSHPPSTPSRLERSAFFDQLRQLELRLAIVDDRFERLASRPDREYAAWRRDTVSRMRALAARASALESAAEPAPRHRRHAASVLATLHRRLSALDDRHDERMAQSVLSSLPID